MSKYFLIVMMGFSLCVTAQVQISGQIQDEDGISIPFATVLFESISDVNRREGAFTDPAGFFRLMLSPGLYQFRLQMVGFETLYLDSLRVTDDMDLGVLNLMSDIVQLEEVVVRGERSHIESDLGKKTLHIGNDLMNSGTTALMAMESLPSVSTTSEGGISVRGSQNVIIYVNGRETTRDPRTLQFISAEALQKIELITNPSSKYDAEGVAGIINLIYNKSTSSKLELYTNLTAPPRISAGFNWSVSTNKFTFFLNANERRSRYETLIDSDRLTSANDLRRYVYSSTTDGKGLTRDISTGVSFEPNKTLAIGLDVNYLRWDDDMNDHLINTFEYSNGTSDLEYDNSLLEIEDEITFSFSLAKEFDHGSLNFQVTSGGEDEINDADFNIFDVDLSDTPITQPIRFSSETEFQRFHNAKLDYTIPFAEEKRLETGTALNTFNYTVNQDLGFTGQAPLVNSFSVMMTKYAGYSQYTDELGRFEYSLGLRLEHFRTETTDLSSDSSFVQSFTNLFPSVQWKYALGRRDHSFGFNLTRRINRPSFWEASPFVSYIDPLNVQTGNPYIRPEFAYLYEVTYSNSIGRLSLDATAFRRTTENVIQQFTEPNAEDQVLLSYRNLGVRNSDGIEVSFSYDLSDAVTLEGSTSGYRTLFGDTSEEVFFQRRFNWQGRLRQKIKLGKGWTMDLTQYYRARRYGVQSFGLPRHYINAAVQKISNNKRATFSLSLVDVFDTSFYGSTVVAENFRLETREKYQSQRLTLGFRYKIKK